MFHLKGVHHIALNCSDVVKVARFFKDILEVPIPEENIVDGAPVYFQIDTYTRIALHLNDGGERKARV
ncbi:VOC family protein, partial [Mesorhizobium sp. M00.F.Ca.ET.186.01.1.1]